MDCQNAVKYILDKKIDGVFVECGVERGDIIVSWIDELMKQKQERDIWLFDTFKGLTQPSEHDFTCSDAVLFKMDATQVMNEWMEKVQENGINQWCYYPLEDVQRRLRATGYPYDRLHFIEGDVMITLQEDQYLPEKIAILRLDTDWYQSSRYELEQLYHRVTEGGLIIFDDYYHWQGQRKATDEFFASIGVEYDMQPIGNGKSASIIKK